MGANYGQKKRLTYKAAATLRDALAELRGPSGYRGDGRPHDTGLVRPYRPVPPDFEEVYVRMGWDGLDEHYRTNWRVIRRWIRESGRVRLIALRARYVEAQRVERRKGKRRAAC